jgi:hypothetical protein
MSLPFDDTVLIKHVLCLLQSYLRWTGRELIPPGVPQERARALFYQPFVVLSHGTQDDQLW